MDEIVVTNLSKSYEHPVFKPLSFAVEKGEMVAIIGASGSGKTTLIECMLGITSGDSGTVSIKGQLMPNIAALSDIGYMAQSDALYDSLTARENLKFFGSMYDKVTSKRIEEVSSITALTAHLDKRVEKFSGGMKRRLSLAICLLHQLDILILDEPTTGLDPLLIEQIWHTFRTLQSSGTTLLITTHNMAEADRADKLLLLFDHEMLAYGTKQTLYQHYGVNSIQDIFIKEARNENNSDQ